VLGAGGQGARRTWDRVDGARSSSRPHLGSWVLSVRREEGIRKGERGRRKEARRPNSRRERGGGKEKEKGTIGAAFPRACVMERRPESERPGPASHACCSSFFFDKSTCITR
jgi:hypothetical protein